MAMYFFCLIHTHCTFAICHFSCHQFANCSHVNCVRDKPCFIQTAGFQILMFSAGKTPELSSGESVFFEIGICATLWAQTSESVRDFQKSTPKPCNAVLSWRHNTLSPKERILRSQRMENSDFRSALRQEIGNLHSRFPGERNRENRCFHTKIWQPV